MSKKCVKPPLQYNIRVSNLIAVGQEMPEIHGKTCFGGLSSNGRVRVLISYPVISNRRYVMTY